MLPDWFEIRTSAALRFDSLASQICQFQLIGNPIYRDYARMIGHSAGGCSSVLEMPYLPISFYKDFSVMTGDFIPETVFESSGTTGVIPSRHAVRHLDIYNDELLLNFERVYGRVEDWCILALLPSYLERGNSSLVYMVQKLIQKGGHPDSGFYLNEWDQLCHQLEMGERTGRKTLLIGVGFALLDLAEKFPFRFRHTTVLETGGMKGRQKEWVREELHGYLSKRFGVEQIHSEYGMTELLSQAYSTGGGLFECPPWMRVLVREEEDPLAIKTSGRGLLNIVDLANIHSCSFLATDDVGEVYPDGSFRVLGRRDGSELRGCSLLLSV